MTIETQSGSTEFAFTGGDAGITLRSSLVTDGDVRFVLGSGGLSLSGVDANVFNVAITTPDRLRVGDGTGTGAAAALVDTASVASISSATLSFESTNSFIELADLDGSLVTALTGRDVTLTALDADQAGAAGVVLFSSDDAASDGQVFSFNTLAINADDRIVFGDNLAGLTIVGGGLGLDVVDASGHVAVRDADDSTGEFTFTADDGVAANALDINILDSVEADAGVSLAFASPTTVGATVLTEGGSITFMDVAMPARRRDRDGRLDGLPGRNDAAGRRGARPRGHDRGRADPLPEHASRGRQRVADPVDRRRCGELRCGRG